MTGARAGGGLSSTETIGSGMPRQFSVSKAASDSPTWRGGKESRGVKEPRHVRTHCTGTWEVSMSPHCRGGVAEERRNPSLKMNDMEKSDSGIVAVKSANKGTPVPAESMERRTEPKGNLEGPSTRRTQGQDPVRRRRRAQPPPRRPRPRTHRAAQRPRPPRPRTRHRRRPSIRRRLPRQRAPLHRPATQGIQPTPAARPRPARRPAAAHPLGASPRPRRLRPPARRIRLRQPRCTPRPRP